MAASLRPKNAIANLPSDQNAGISNLPLRLEDNSPLGCGIAEDGGWSLTSNPATRIINYGRPRGLIPAKPRPSQTAFAFQAPAAE